MTAAKTSLNEILETDGVYQEMYRWMIFRKEVIVKILPPEIVEAIGWPLHMTPEVIRELTRRILDDLPQPLQEAADIVEKMDF